MPEIKGDNLNVVLTTLIFNICKGVLNFELIILNLLPSQVDEKVEWK